jgi:hypothetical protein
VSPDPARRPGSRLDAVRDAAYAVAGVGTVLAVVHVITRSGSDLGDQDRIASTALFAVIIGIVAAGFLEVLVVGPLVLLVAKLMGLRLRAPLGDGPLRLMSVVPPPDTRLLRLRMAALTVVGPLAGAAVTAAGMRLVAAERDDLLQAMQLFVVVAGMLVTAAHAAPYRLTGRGWSDGWELCRWLFRPARARDDLTAAYLQAAGGGLRRAVRGRAAGDETTLAVDSAVLAQVAWGDALPGTAAAAGAHLAGNEAETHLFGLDRLACCCRADGSVPVAPAERLAAAAALAERAVSLAPGDAHTAGALALVRLAQGRPDDAHELIRPHLGTGTPAWRAELLAILAMSQLAADPGAALGIARAAADLLARDDGAAGSTLVRLTLAHVESRTTEPV